MQIIKRPDNAQEIKVEGATVPFYKYNLGEDTIIEFDTSRCGPPEPMVNAMAGLKLIKDKHTKLLMINHKRPMGLLQKIGENFEIEEAKMDDGRVQLLFSYKKGASEEANLNDASCSG